MKRKRFPNENRSPAQLKATLQKVREGGNGMFVAESRPHNDWLGPGWYRDLDVCVEFARKNDLQMIIFDDYWWPSQMMGGRVPPQYGSKVLEAAAVTVTGPKRLREPGYGDENLISVVAGKEAGADTVDSATLLNLTTSIENGALIWDVPPGAWRIMKCTWAYQGKRGHQKQMISVDGASPECVDWFIKTVYQPHYDRYREDFGKTIVGFFYDEPETQGDWGSDVQALAAERNIDLDKLLVGCGVPEIANAFARCGIGFQLVTGLLGLEQLDTACRVASALEKLVREFDLDALTYYYRGRDGNVYEQLQEALILGHSLLTAQGIPCSGEGDMKTAVAMKVCDTLGVGGSYSEIVAADYKRGTIILGHDGPFHIAIAESRPVLRGMGLYHGKWGTGVSVEATVRKGPVTVLNLTQTRDGALRFIVNKGDAIDAPILKIGNTMTHVKFPKPPTQTMNEWFALAPTHHAALSVGHNPSQLRKVATMLGVDLWSPN